MHPPAFARHIMHPSRIGAPCAALALGLVAAAATTHAASPVASRPNVIVIVTDDQGYGDVACHGNPWLRTPNLDRLHAESVCLEDYHVDPVCTPTRAALLTGRYSRRTGAWTITEGRQLLHRDEVTMADVFAASGYATAMFGKWHLGDTYPFSPQHRGFQHVVCHRAGGVDEIGNPAGNDFFDDTYYRNGRPERFPGYSTDVWVEETQRFIRDQCAAPAPRPFFAYLALNAMHHPFTVDESHAAPFHAQGHPDARARFYGMIANFDQNLGRLMGTLRELGIERDTIVIFMGDNGTAAVPEGGPALYNAGMREQKGSLYEGGHRVGCWVRWPARFAGGRKVGHLTAHLDWLPTLVDLCGLKTPRRLPLDGRSLRPLLDRDGGAWPERTLVISRQPGRLEDRAEAVTTRGNRARFAVLTERWRLVNGELYDIAADPGQQRDVAAGHPATVAELAAAYARWLEDVSRERRDFVHFLLGTPQENPILLTVRDWHPTRGSVIWQQAHLGDDDRFIQGFWAVDVTRPGRYEIRLSRHPQDQELPMGADRASLSVGPQRFAREVSAEATSATFHVELPTGPAMLETVLRDARTGAERGAYFVQVRFLDRQAMRHARPHANAPKSASALFADTRAAP